jgi:phosphatidylcholine synthase
MPPEQSPIHVNPGQRLVAWAVHAFSATGAVLGLLALIAIDGHRWTEAMLWLLAALVVDGVDGTFARAARVKELAPRIDGDVLDLVIDYLNYVFVPTAFLLESGLLAGGLALPLAGLIQLSSLYVFARRDMKTDDGYFRGFPALWNIVALYLFATSTGGAAAAIIVAGLVLLSFAPVHVAHPFRVRDYGRWLPALALVWTGSTLLLLLPIAGLARQISFAVSAASAVLLILAGLLRTVRGKRQPDSSTQ